ncbi:16S rRNA (guanine(527)-N(7))-methyltransferase RsmG [Nocardioides marmoriginsengisoli]|uniref:Ribosomal RNA small subunit methyltransferase G n=1 Tax=Nocardioides marmoriginsengisoli TaxID=661483 RepID=A0A3N0CBN9_9ACTN|nr:16S rRNA (guanine(527)-N(7))-methyltransferase RsmG [Nocardioides marmoriginsengisoli]RNL60865.1 16S rRNA (guanine(527)-N(7))-methyltransferase RsmG [Nocardioides marmoriginsengisoli]
MKPTDPDTSNSPSAPDVARRVFSQSLPTAEAYAELLATDGIVRGLIGPREVPRLWDRHLLNCAVVTDAVDQGASVCDIGSGAGLPGLVMAIRRPDLMVTLVEPLLRRTTFLEEAVGILALKNVRVRRGRAEDLHGVATFDVVTSRAVAPMDRLSRWSLPLVRSGGSFLAMKGSSAETEVADAAKVIGKEKGQVQGVIELGTGLLETPVRVVRIVKR